MTTKDFFLQSSENSGIERKGRLQVERPIDMLFLDSYKIYIELMEKVCVPNRKNIIKINTFSVPS